MTRQSPRPGVAFAATFAAVTLLAAAAIPAAAAVASAPADPACQQAPSPGASIPPLAPRDPLITELGLDQAWALSTGAGVTVGVVDTGVDPASPKLAGAVDVGRSFHVVETKAVYASAPGARTDCDGHGTEVAGIVAGRTEAGDDRVSGVAPDARIYPVALQTSIAQAPAAMIAAAIRDAAQHATVINLSFAQASDSPEIRAAVENAVQHNVVVVAASANEGGANASGSTRPWYPAAYPGVLAVAATGTDDAPAADGDWISIAAPGKDLTTVTRGGEGYVTVSGTSFATAIVSGAAALVRARYPNLSAADVIARLEKTAVPPGDGTRDDSVGYGVVDPYRALTLAPGASRSNGGPSASVAPQPLLATPRAPADPNVLGTTVLLVAAAALIAIASIAIRSGRRRGWHAGRSSRTTDDRRPEPQPADLG